jgi:hypothetical protein
MLGLAQAASGHLACLRDCGLVTWRPVGCQPYYRLAVPSWSCRAPPNSTTRRKDGDCPAPALEARIARQYDADWPMVGSGFKESGRGCRSLLVTSVAA